MDDRGPLRVPNARPIREALRFDPIYFLLGPRLSHPLVLGFVSALIVVLMIILGPATESRFIYTDF